MWTFAMITPDAMVGGYMRFVLDRLAAHGLEVRGARLIALDWHRLGQMYTHRDDPPPSKGAPGELPQRVMERLYRLAPAAVLALHGSPEAMLACKGATRPEQAAAGTVRAAGEHLIFNYAHCPDDAASAAIELAYLVGREDALALQARAEAAEPTGEPVLDQLHMVVPAYAGWEAISFPMAANRLRCRAVQRRYTPEAHRALFLERQALLAARGAADRLRVAQAANPTVHAAVLAAADPAWVPGLEALAALYEVNGPRDLAAIEALRGQGLYLSEQELVTLDAHGHAYFPPG
jgi:nucleoside diphosphate kinase